MAKRDGEGGWIADSTEIQYARISGNWAKYYNRLRNIRGRQHLSVEDLLFLHASQNGLCALSGVPLTCDLKVGEVCLTNASLDRIEHGGKYNLNNIRLVCSIVNKMRWNMSDEDLKVWCERIINNDKET